MIAFIGEIHPLAARWPLMPDDELAALAASIKADGLQHPIVIDKSGRLIDGRNRLEACRRAGVSPTYLTPANLNGEESVRRWIHRANGQRRNVSTGQKAMEYADLLASEGKRKNGRWVKGSIVGSSQGSSAAWVDAMARAGLVIDFRPDLTDSVISGETTLNDAATHAEAARDEQRRQEAATQREAERLADLREHRPDLAQLVDDGKLPLADALTVRDREHAASEKARRERQELVTKFSSDLTFAINCIAPLGHYPDRQEQVRTGLDLAMFSPPITRDLVEEAIESLKFLLAARKEDL